MDLVVVAAAAVVVVVATDEEEEAPAVGTAVEVAVGTAVVAMTKCNAIAYYY